MVVTIARCGLACEVCKHFINQQCLGCEMENEIDNRCLIFNCAKKRQIKHCLQCQEFPCEFMNLSKTYCPVFSKINNLERSHKIMIIPQVVTIH
ncbi:MAG: DUF3795 domain-containing protein [Methanobacterium sp.]